MGHDLAGFNRQIVGDPLIDQRFIFRGAVGDVDMRVGHGGLLHVAVHRPAAFLVHSLQFHGHPGAVVHLPFDGVVLQDHRGVLYRVQADFEAVGRLFLSDARDDPDRLAGGQLGVHAGGGDADALLAPLLFQAVEFGAVQQFAEDLRDLGLDDPRAVVLHGDPVA